MLRDPPRGRGRRPAGVPLRVPCAPRRGPASVTPAPGRPRSPATSAAHGSQQACERRESPAGRNVGGLALGRSRRGRSWRIGIEDRARRRRQRQPRAGRRRLARRRGGPERPESGWRARTTTSGATRRARAATARQAARERDPPAPRTTRAVPAAAAASPARRARAPRDPARRGPDRRTRQARRTATMDPAALAPAPARVSRAVPVRATIRAALAPTLGRTTRGPLDPGEGGSASTRPRMQA
jgi:hypothetical protein